MLAIWIITASLNRKNMMAITKADNRELDQIYSDFKDRYAGCREDYFACLYLSKKFGRRVEDIARQCSFGNHDYGVDAYFVDRDTRNLYLFQFKWSENHNLFKESLEKLAKDGMDSIFGNTLANPKKSDLLINLKGDLDEYKFLIKRVLIHMVFKGELDAAENSKGLQDRRENLENKRHLVKTFFGDPEVELRVEFITDLRSSLPPAPTQDTFTLGFRNTASITTSDGQKTLHVGFLPLMDLYRIYRSLGQTFLSRNIRFGLSSDKSPNKKLREAFSNIVLKQTLSADVFPFNHNGVTLAAESVVFESDHCVVKVPRLLNGAQTLTSLATFLQENVDHPALKTNDKVIESIKVLAKIVVDDPLSDFVTNVTICNNRQNPVNSWNLRANDRIQCDLHDRLKEATTIFYSRHENEFQNLSTKELEAMGYDSSREIKIKPLAQTFLAAQGEIGRMSQLPEVFENQKLYDETFKDTYLHCDARKIVLGYKVFLCLKSPMERLEERAGRQIVYAIGTARNLVWALSIQGFLNDNDKLSQLLDDFGNRLTRDIDFREYLKNLASSRLLPIFRELLADEVYKQKIEKERYDFLRTKEIFRRCMEIAHDKHGWVRKSF